jgi:signal recognition particle subunit SRP54
MGDVVSLVEKAQEVIDEGEAERAVTKLLQDEFTFEDFLYQLRATKKLGPLKDVLAMLPGGVGQQLQNAPIDDRMFDRIEAMICSMTTEERLHPDLIDVNRRRRIARGSGNGLDQVNQLLKQFTGMRHMMKQLKSGGMMGRMASRLMPGASGMKKHKAAVLEDLRKKGRLARAKRKAERSQRKRNRRRH